MSETPLSVVLAGGGTAGHISPLLAIANALVERDPSVRITVVGTATGMEVRLVPAAGFPLETIERVPLPRSVSIDAVKLPVRLIRAVRQSLRIVNRAGADVVVGVGGYVSTPLYLAAWLRKVPVVIHEANARPGLANRLGARIATTVAVAFDATDLPDARWVGMPMRRAIANLHRGDARKAARASLQLDAGLPTLIVTGGSSGAASINRTVAAVVPLLAGAGVQLLHITGKGKQATHPDGRVVEGPGYRQVEFVDGMETVYAAADLLVARAGAATVCEVSAVGLPAVLVPLPHGNGEQRLNAAELVKRGGAILVDDEQFTVQWLQDEVFTLLRNPQQLQTMARASAGLGIRDADRRMAELVFEAAERTA